MSKKSFLKFLFFLFLVLSFLSFGQFVFANGECYQGEIQDCDTCGVKTCECREKEINIGTEEVPNIITITICNWSDCKEAPKPSDYDEESWYEYRCQGNDCAEQYIEKRHCSHYRTRTVFCEGSGEWNTDDLWSNWSTPDCGTPSTIEQCDLDWQLCSGSNEWSKSTRSCDCAGTCLETPENPRYYNNPDYPINPYEPEESENSNNIFLPVKLDWDNVKAWKNGWQKEDEVLKECSEDCFQSYLIEINNTATGNFSKALTQDSEYNPTQNQGACFLKSGITHNWNVSACCNARGTNCSSKSEWNFTTNSAPELVSPQDPNWNNQETKDFTEINIPISLKWCNVEQANSYRLGVYYVDTEEVCHPDFIGEDKSCQGRFVEKVDGEQMEFQDDKTEFFSKAQTYAWQITSCLTHNGANCQDFSQKWNFKTQKDYKLAKPILLYPDDDKEGKKAVGLPVTLSWDGGFGANSFIYYVNPYDGSKEITGTTNYESIVFSGSQLKLNTFYAWAIQPCWDEKSEECEQNAWSDEWTFKTTGAPPKLIYPAKSATGIPIPIKLNWEHVSGSKSYKYWVYYREQLITDNEDNIIAGSPVPAEISIEYNPNLKEPKQETNYSWQIATCADEKGSLCGIPTTPQNFITFKLSPPTNLLPEDNKKVFTYQMPQILSWDSSAKYFRVLLSYVEKSLEESSDCPLRDDEYFVEATSYFVSPTCLGKYQWQVQSCLDKSCEERGKFSPNRKFELQQTVPPDSFGLIPCGRSSDNLDTPSWNERDPCQFKHIFILFKNILDFLLWRVTLIVLLLLVIATAMIFYFSIGAPVMIIDIKGVWRAAGKGYAIIFLSWTIINLVLNILGYQVGIFGNWWQIKF